MTIRQQILKRARRGVRHPLRPVEPITLTARQQRKDRVSQLKRLNHVHERLTNMQELIHQNRKAWQNGNFRSRLEYGKASARLIRIATHLGTLGGIVTGAVYAPSYSKLVATPAGGLTGRAIGYRLGRYGAREILKLHPTSRDYRTLTKALKRKVKQQAEGMSFNSQDIARNKRFIDRLEKTITTLIEQNRAQHEAIVTGNSSKRITHEAAASLLSTHRGNNR